MPAERLQLEQWSNFYVITSAAAATLLGLLFVVITLALERKRRDTASVRIYVTPAVIYFSSVLLMSALLTVPSQTRLSAVVCICLGGVVGLGYTGSLAVRRGGSAYYLERSDLFPYVVFPSAAYALMVVGGVLLLRGAAVALNLVAAGMLGLLGFGIRNSWAIALTIISSGE